MEEPGARSPCGLPAARQSERLPPRPQGCLLSRSLSCTFRPSFPLPPSLNGFPPPLPPAGLGPLPAGAHRVSQRSSRASPFATRCQLPGCQSGAPTGSPSSPRFAIAFSSRLFEGLENTHPGRVPARHPTRRTHPGCQAACGVVVGDLPRAPRLWASLEVTQRGPGLGWEGALRRARKAGGGAGVGSSGFRTHTYTPRSARGQMCEHLG